MKNIIKSLVVVVAVAAVAGTATYSYFTDKAVVDNNTFSAGKLDFTLNGDMTETKSLNLSGMEPGTWYGPYSMKVYNKNTPTSTMPMKYRFYDKKESESVAGFYNKLNAKVEHGHCVAGGISPTTYSWTGKLKDMYFDSTTSAISAYLGVNITHCFELSFQLDPSAGNAYQGASAVADVVVDGTQTTNPGW